MIALPNIKNCLSWIIQGLNLSGVKGSDSQKLYELSHKKDVPKRIKATMQTHLRYAVILGAFTKIWNNEILMTMRKVKIEIQKQKEKQKEKAKMIAMN